MARTYARAPRGQRAIGAVPHGHWQASTFLAAQHCDQLTVPCVIDGPINAPTFQAYVEQILVPTLQRGNTVIVDNLGSHKGRAARHAIEQAGTFLLHLPPYSPPIHLALAKSLSNYPARRTITSEAMFTRKIIVGTGHGRFHRFKFYDAVPSRGTLLSLAPGPA